MAEQYDCQQVLELLFDDGFDLSDSDDSEDEDARESNYLGDEPLDLEELASVGEAVIQGSLDELTTRSTSIASASASPDCSEWNCEEDILEDELLGKYCCLSVK